MSRREEPPREEHPSYGVLVLTRVTGGGGKLFGTTVESFSRMRLTFSRASRVRDLSEDRIYANNDTLLAVEMSAAQFAEAILSVGLGQGVPCTIRHVAGATVPDCPAGTEPLEKIRLEFAAAMREASASVAAGTAGLEAILAKKSLTVADRASVRSIVGEMRRLFEDRLAFAQSQFTEAAGEQVHASRSEVAAYVSSLINSAGVAHLARSAQALALPAPHDTTDTTDTPGDV